MELVRPVQQITISPTFPGMQRIRALDGLRGLSAVLVVWDHFPKMRDASWIWQIGWVVQPGPVGVTMFFVLSGFLITRILLREKSSGTLSLRTFYLKRALRIFPIYYLALLVVGVFMTWRHAGWLAAYMSNFLFAFDSAPHPLRHTWSLAVEEHFYLVWPLLLWSLSIRNAQVLVTWILPACALGSALVFCNMLSKGTSDALIYRSTFCQVLPLCAGGILAFHERSVGHLRSGWIAALVAGVPVLWLVGAIAQDLVSGPLLVSAYTIKLLCFTLTATCAVLVCLNAGKEGPVQRMTSFVFTGPVLTFLGTISYGLYLFHYPILFRLGYLHGQVELENMSALALLGLLIAVPTISWYGFESPILKWKDRLVRQRSTAV